MFLTTDIGTNNLKDRELWLNNTLKKIPAGLRILDVGAGEQQYKKFCGHLDYVSQDFAKYDGKGNQKGKQTQKWNYGKLDIISDITKIPCHDKSFDAIMCIEVLEHVPDPIAAIREFRRLLKKNGYLIITAPFCSLSHFSPYHFYSGFNSHFYNKFLPENGFDVISLTPNGNYFQYLAQEVRRAPNISRSGTFMKITARILTGLYLLLISRLSHNDTNSNDLLCFGYHVFARKKI